jgi:hypothetical protein
MTTKVFTHRVVLSRIGRLAALSAALLILAHTESTGRVLPPCQEENIVFYSAGCTAPVVGERNRWCTEPYFDSWGTTSEWYQGWRAGICSGCANCIGSCEPAGEYGPCASGSADTDASARGGSQLRFSTNSRSRVLAP